MADARVIVALVANVGLAIALACAQTLLSGTGYYLFPDVALVAFPALYLPAGPAVGVAIVTALFLDAGRPVGMAGSILLVATVFACFFLARRRFRRESWMHVGYLAGFGYAVLTVGFVILVAGLDNLTPPMVRAIAANMLIGIILTGIITPAFVDFQRRLLRWWGVDVDAELLD